MDVVPVNFILVNHLEDNSPCMLPAQGHLSASNWTQARVRDGRVDIF